MAKATTTIIQRLHYQSEHAAYFAANQALFNTVVAFYFDVIQTHEQTIYLSGKVWRLSRAWHRPDGNAVDGGAPVLFAYSTTIVQ